MKDAKVLSSEVLVDGFKKVIKERIQFTEHDVQDWVYLDSPKSIMVVAITPNKEIVLVRLYRHNLKKDVCELPAGNPEHDGEDPIDAAKRELLEETGFSSETFIDLGSYYVLPSETNRYVHYYLARNALQKHTPTFDKQIEKYFDMSVVLLPFYDLLCTTDAAAHDLTGIESLFGIHLAHEYLSHDRS